jgi:hypothetical protein
VFLNIRLGLKLILTVCELFVIVKNPFVDGVDVVVAPEL